MKSFTNPEFIRCLFSVSENLQIPTFCPAKTNSNTINLDVKGIKMEGKKTQKKTPFPAFVHLEQMIFHDLPCCNLRSRCSCQRAYPGLPAKCLNPLACMIFWLFCLQSIRFTQDEKLLLQRSAENEPVTHILSAQSRLCLFRYNMLSNHAGAVMNRELFVYCVWAFFLSFWRCSAGTRSRGRGVGKNVRATHEKNIRNQMCPEPCFQTKTL